MAFRVMTIRITIEQWYALRDNLSITIKMPDSASSVVQLIGPSFIAMLTVFALSDVVLNVVASRVMVIQNPSPYFF